MSSTVTITGNANDAARNVSHETIEDLSLTYRHVEDAMWDALLKCVTIVVDVALHLQSRPLAMRLVPKISQAPTVCKCMVTKRCHRFVSEDCHTKERCQQVGKSVHIRHL